jgi:hypothetical protein
MYAATRRSRNAARPNISKRRLINGRIVRGIRQNPASCCFHRAQVSAAAERIQ